MRGIVLTFIVFASLPLILVKPYFGVLVWSWISYFNPHRYVWGFAAEIRFALVVGALTIIAYAISREPKRLPPSKLTAVLFLFMCWIAFSDLFALFPEFGEGSLSKAVKIIIFNGFLTMALITTRDRIHWLVWIIVMSIGFFGLKGGVFTIVTGGANRVWGPPGFMEDNNALALALLMVMPLMRYLQLTTEKLWVRWSLGISILLCLASVFGSHSRGALVAMVLMFPFFWIKSKHKLMTASLLVVGLGLGLAFMPSNWVERMGTIKTYEEDGSAQSRLQSWGYAIDMANSRPLTGGGFGAFAQNYQKDTFGGPYWNAHSIYFQVLGEQGYVGLLLFLTLLVGSFWKAGQIAHRTRGDPNLKWAHDLAAMLQVSIFAYASAGAFQNLQFFDLAYHLFAMTIALGEIVRQAQEGTEKRKISRESFADQFSGTGRLPAENFRQSPRG